ncbi:SIR2 family protein [Leeuwenhoekiella polynyae]|uniref:SIR2-like protein n=1 Tax=Leeuwenhoekiella polynyae TaxID=1550906 RepID=A0A4Q0NXD7_9FLAO|nr:SIR2 family protein [Leeuwenhoekiella polynyae]RXG15757.1 SIR2-like protein [Leeuwenhoekiella polynyae]
MAEKIKENWKYLLINGKSKTLEVKDSEFDKGKLTNLTDIRPFNKNDSEGKEISPTVELANKEKRKVYTTFFQKPFKNLVLLTGAGSSMDVKGLSMNQLWDESEKEFKSEKVDGLNNIIEAVKFPNEKKDKKDIEALLSQIEGFVRFSDDIEVDSKDGRKKLSKLKELLFKLIQEKCTIPTPSNDAFPHKVLLEKVLQRKLTSPRVKIFTLNYDLLFEDAATAVNAIVIDGFSYTFPRTFSGRYFDYDIVQREGSKLKEEDNFVQRVFHLHKLHGSINWERIEETGSVVINEKPKKALMVYPREAKYEDSYEQPFFEMMARFQRNLRLNDDTLLVCIGYSFNDKHINAAIEEALNQNPGFRLAIIDPGFDNDAASKSLKTIKETALQTERILMVSETFTDFANYFPEIKTYENTQQVTINLKNE